MADFIGGINDLYQRRANLTDGDRAIVATYVADRDYFVEAFRDGQDIDRHTQAAFALALEHLNELTLPVEPIQRTHNITDGIGIRNNLPLIRRIVAIALVIFAIVAFVSGLPWPVGLSSLGLAVGCLVPDMLNRHRRTTTQREQESAGTYEETQRLLDKVREQEAQAIRDRAIAQGLAASQQSEGGVRRIIGGVARPEIQDAGNVGPARPRPGIIRGTMNQANVEAQRGIRNANSACAVIVARVLDDLLLNPQTPITRERIDTWLEAGAREHDRVPGALTFRTTDEIQASGRFHNMRIDREQDRHYDLAGYGNYRDDLQRHLVDQARGQSIAAFLTKGMETYGIFYNPRTREFLFFDSHGGLEHREGAYIRRFNTLEELARHLNERAGPTEIDGAVDYAISQYDMIVARRA